MEGSGKDKRRGVTGRGKGRRIREVEAEVRENKRGMFVPGKFVERSVLVSMCIWEEKMDRKADRQGR